jgi:Copper resistance protein D
VLLVTGVLNAIVLVPRPESLMTTSYGQVLLVKIGLVAVMIGIATRNRFVPVSAGWRSWPMSIIPPSCWRCASFRQRPARSASRFPHSKSGEARISRPPSRRSTAARMPFMSVPTRS